MKFKAWTHWVLRNLFRNRLRTVLTLGSVAVSLFLLAMLSAAYQFLNAPPTGPDQSHLLLIVSPRAAMTMPMPLSYRNRIAALPGVAVVSPFGYIGALYGGKNDFIPAVALDPGTVLEFFGEWKMPGDEDQDFVREKSALIAGRKLAQRYGWKLGDHVHLKSPEYSNLVLDLTLRGIYDATDGDESTVAFHWDYLNDAIERTNQADMFWVRARSAKVVPQLTQAIDAEFHNSPVETRTGTLKQVMLNFLALLGNVKLMLTGISIAVVFAVILVVSNTMSMSIRERTPELATLRAIGFRSGQLLRLVVGESAIVALAGAAVACLGAAGLCRMLSGLAIGGEMPAHITMGVPTVLLVVAVALGISLATTLVPAYRASRLSIADALRYVG